MSPAEYGIMDLLDLAMTLAALCFGMRLGEAMLYYYFKEQTPERRNAVVTTTFIFSGLMGIAAAAAGWFVSPALSRVLLGDAKYVQYVRLMWINLGVVFTYETGLTYLRGLNQSAKFVTVSLVRLTASIGLVLVLMIGYGMTVASFLWSTIITAVGLSIYMYMTALRSLPLVLNYEMLRAQIRYSWPLALQGLSMLVMNFGDRFFLRRVVSLGELGIYAIAYKLGLVMGYLQGPFDTYWRAQSFSILKAGNAREIYAQTCTYLFLVLGTALTGVVVFLGPALRLLVGPKFADVEPYVPWLALAYLFRAMADYFRTVMRTENQTKYEGLVGAISTVVCLVAYASLIPAWHVWGAVAATVIAFLCMMIVSFWLGQRVKRHDFEWARMAKIAIAGAAVSVAARTLAPTGLLLGLAFSTALMLIYFGLLAQFRFFNQDERRLLRQAAIALVRKGQQFRAISA
jgi:O-antigen/teichoic acid export membrane protein